MPAPIQGQARDLVERRLLGAREAIPLGPARRSTADVLGATIERGGSDLARLARAHASVHERMRNAIDEFAPLMVDGMGYDLLEATFGAPQRTVHLDQELLLIGAYQVRDLLAVVKVSSIVSRRTDQSISDVGEISVDEFRLPSDRPRFVSLLRSLASSTGFTPRGGLRIGALVSSQVAQDFANIEESLVAAAAVAGGTVALLPKGDPNDTKYLQAAVKWLASGSHQKLVSMSYPREKWVARSVTQAQRGRPWLRLPFIDIGQASDVLASSVEKAVTDGPPYPAVRWGQDARSRVDAWEGPAFRLTPRAKSHLSANRYPDVERMISSLEDLALLAQEWHDDTTAGVRFEDWAKPRSALLIALSDKNISLTSAKLDFEGVILDNRPHVKVDDYTSPTHCGRIYFALDGVRRRIVVDYIGLHGRS